MSGQQSNIKQQLSTALAHACFNNEDYYFCGRQNIPVHGMVTGTVLLIEKGIHYYGAATQGILLLFLILG